MDESLRGKLLLASPQMGDPNFERAVILVVQHDPAGAMGLVLNQPTDAAVREVVEASVGLECGTDELLYRGGPCEGPLMVLHSDPGHAQEEVLEGVFFATDREFVEPVLEGRIQPARFFAGYAGWGAGQLEGELAVDSWTVVEADAAIVFERHLDAWSLLMRINKPSGLLSQLDPKIVPRDPSMN